MHGDIIIFGAELWKLSLPNTLTKFSEMGLIAENDADRVLGDYERYFNRRTAVENFLFDAMSQVWNHGDDVIACRLRDLGVRHEIENCYGLLGVAHYDQIAKVCLEVGRPKPPRLRDDGPSIVFPFYDLPGRLTGVLLLQYNEAYESKQTYVPLSGARKQRPEAGYYLLSAAWRAKQPTFKNTQFIFDDPLWVVKAQCQAFARQQGWLPIMASYTGPEAESYGTSWQSFGHADRIFHGHSPTPELISRACNAKGYISVVHNSRVSVFPKLSTIRTNVQTWQQALRNTLAGANEMNAEAFAKRLTIAPDKLQGFLTKVSALFSPGFQERVMLAATAPADAPLKVQRRWFVVERDSGWWSQSGRQIANFRVSIDEVIHADNGEKTYKGRVFMGGDVYAFTESSKRIEHGGLLTYADGLLSHNGKLAVFDWMWNKKAHLLAMHLHPPKLINVSTEYGWDAQANVFRFAGYELTHNGDVTKTHVWPKQPKNKEFQEPLPIAPLPIHDIITPAHENSFIWATAATILANLIAPIARKDYVATAIPPRMFSLVARIAAAMGCDVEKTMAFQKHVAGKFLETKTADAIWPVACFGAFNDEVFGHCVPRCFNRPLLLKVTKQNTAVALSYGWQSLSSAPFNADADISPLRAIVPAYIQRALKTRANFFRAESSLHARVLEDLNTWLTETYGMSFNLPHAKTLSQYPSHAHAALMAEINDAILAGKIAVLPQPRTSKQAKNYILVKKDCWWLNQQAIDRYFYTARCVGPNWLMIIELLQKDGVYVGEEVVQNMSGVLVKSNWCERFHATPSILRTEIG